VLHNRYVIPLPPPVRPGRARSALRSHITNLKAYIRYPYKLIITSYVHPPYVSTLKTLVADSLFFLRDPLVQLEDVILSLELFDLEADPMESRNLLSGTSQGSLRHAISDRLGDLTHMVIDMTGKKFSIEAAVRRALAQ
jgi:hypothetical protein